ncbi:TIGR04388 family protein [Leptospira bouyouniensis]|uniref:TIGR04388 family protein n=1 Tax=Leptospira bouyouniensis TaxID=2484911 RepID=A0A7I0HWH0_9LEPT|nr:TIGR04388 family protein [Leptospira bouyouniensis]TGL09161.1 TIGR04388 family protein [Leptospira bouyouniensis]
MKKLNAKGNHFTWISLFWKKSNQRYTSAILIFAYLLTFFSPLVSLSAQVTVPVLNNQQFQNQDLMEAYAIADRQATSVEHWDTLVNTYLYNLYTNWQETAEAKISEFVAAVNTSDAYNSVEAYREYVYNGLQGQKAILEQNWMEEAETAIQLRRESFLLSNTLSTYNSVEVNSTQTQTNLGTNPNQNAIEQAQEAVRIAREQWEREHANAIANGLFQYELAIGSADRTYENLVSQIATTESQFLTQLENLRTYENTVRTQISTKVNQLQTYLQSNSVFYETDANGTPIIDINHLTSDGQNLKSLMTQMQDAIANKSSLTTISGMLKDYLAAQESVAASNKSYWQGKVYGVSDLNNIISAANVGNNFLSDPVIAAIKSYFDNGYDVNALKSFINQRLGLNTNFKYVQSISAIDMVGTSSSYNPYPVTIGSGGTGENYSSVGDNAFTYWATGCGYWGVFLCITQDFQEESVRTNLEFTLYDANADSNASAWGSYSTSLDGMVSTWESAIIPAISNWENQVSLYASQYASWKAQSESILAEAALTRDAEVSGISEARANWLSKMNALQQSGDVVWGTVESSLSEKSAAIQNAVSSGITGKELSDFISSKASDLTEILSVLPQRPTVELDTKLIQTAGLQTPQVSDSFFTAANNSFLTDLGSIQQFMNSLDKTFTGAQNLALANSMNTIAENATMNGMSQIYNSLTAAGATASYDSNGNIVVTQSIYNGQANLRAGADATSASSYDAGMSNYSTVVVAPESIKLSNTGGLFDTWNNSTIFTEFQSNANQFSSSFNQVAARLNSSLTDVARMNQRGAEAFQASAISQANTAQMVKSLAETLASGGTVQSWAKSQAEGYVKSQVAQAISNATGGAVSADLIVAFLNKRQADKAKKEAERKKTMQVVQTVAAIATVIAVGVMTGGFGLVGSVGTAGGTGGGAAVAGGSGGAAVAGGSGGAAIAGGSGGAAIAGGSGGGFLSAVGSIASSVGSAFVSVASSVATFFTTTVPTFVAGVSSAVVTGISTVLSSTEALMVLAANTTVQTISGYEIGGNNGAAAGFVNGVAMVGTGGGLGLHISENEGNFGAAIGINAGGIAAGLSVDPTGSLSAQIGLALGSPAGPTVGVNIGPGGNTTGVVTVPFNPATGFEVSFGDGQATEVGIVTNVGVGTGTNVSIGTGGVEISTNVGNVTSNVGVDTNGNITGDINLNNGPGGTYDVSFGTGQATTVTVTNGNTNAVIGPDGVTVTTTTGSTEAIVNVNGDGEISGNVTSVNPGGSYEVSFGTGEATTIVATDGTSEVQIGPDGVSVSTEINGEQVSVDSNGNTTINGSTPEELINSIDLTNPLTFGVSPEAFADLTAGLAIDEVNGFVDFLNSYPADLAALGLSGMLGAYLFTIGRREEEEDALLDGETESDQDQPVDGETTITDRGGVPLDGAGGGASPGLSMKDPNIGPGGTYIDAQFTFKSIADTKAKLEAYNAKFGTNFTYAELMFYNTPYDTAGPSPGNSAGSSIIPADKKMFFPPFGSTIDNSDLFQLEEFVIDPNDKLFLYKQVNAFNLNNGTEYTWQQIADLNGIKNPNEIKTVTKFYIPSNIDRAANGLESLGDIRKAAAEKAKAELIIKMMKEESSNVANREDLVGTPGDLSGPEKLGWEIISIKPPVTLQYPGGYFTSPLNPEVIYEQKLSGYNKDGSPAVNMQKVTEKLVTDENGYTYRKKTFEVWDATSDPADWVTLNHGDAITSDPEGRLRVIPQGKIEEYITKNNIHNAQVTVNGMDNQGLDAIQMYQATTAIRNQESPREAVIPTFHIFKDDNLANNAKDVVQGSYNPATNGYFGSQSVIESIQKFISAGAFTEGGTLIGHSAGAFNVARAISAGLKSKAIDLEKLENLNVQTYGGVHDMILNSVVNSWIDTYNSKDVADLVSYPGEDKTKDNYVKITDSTGPAYNESVVRHNFLTEYTDDFREHQEI